jgi:serine/threonine protein kinase
MVRRESHGLAVDVWSFGICTLELANNAIPNRHNSIYAMFTNTVKGFPKPFTHNSAYSPLFHEFIQGALNTDPKLRLSSKDLRDHAWCKTAASGKSMQKVISKIFTNHALDDLF